MGGGCGGMGSGGMPDMFPRPQTDNIVVFLKTLTDGFQR